MRLPSDDFDLVRYGICPGKSSKNRVSCQKCRSVSSADSAHRAWTDHPLARQFFEPLPSICSIKAFFLGYASTRLLYEILHVRKATIELLESPISTGQRIQSSYPAYEAPLMLDGDINGHTPTTVEVIPHAVNVMIPKGVFERIMCHCSLAEPGSPSNKSSHQEL